MAGDRLLENIKRLSGTLGLIGLRRSMGGMASKSVGRCYHRSTLLNRIPRRDSAVAVDSFSGLAARG
jgi:hypothetical protein